jgi:hypothetical protein
MARDQVLAGLADRYRLKKENIGDGIEVWEVNDEKGAALGEILFEEGKVRSVIEHIIQPLSGEAVHLAKALFAEFFNHTKPPENLDEVGKKLQMIMPEREAALSVTVRERRSSESETKEIFFDIDNVRLTIEVFQTLDGVCSSGCVFLKRIRSL